MGCQTVFMDDPAFSRIAMASRKHQYHPISEKRLDIGLFETITGIWYVERTMSFCTTIYVHVYFRLNST